VRAAYNRKFSFLQQLESLCVVFPLGGKCVWSVYDFV